MLWGLWGITCSAGGRRGTGRRGVGSGGGGGGESPGAGFRVSPFQNNSDLSFLRVSVVFSSSGPPLLVDAHTEHRRLPTLCSKRVIRCSEGRQLQTTAGRKDFLKAIAAGRKKKKKKKKRRRKQKESDALLRRIHLRKCTGHTVHVHGLDSNVVGSQYEMRA